MRSILPLLLLGVPIPDRDPHRPSQSLNEEILPQLL